jgi:hypothetical protein
MLDCPEEMCHEDVLRLLERAVAFLQSCWARAAVEKSDSGVRAEAVVPDSSLPLDREGYLFLIHQLHGALLMQGIHSDDKELQGALVSALRELMHAIAGALGEEEAVDGRLLAT